MVRRTEPEADAAPVHSAAKDDWATYRQAQGHDVEGKTKQELIDLPDAPVLEPVRSRITNVFLDPVDGRPVFGDGMSRRRWLDATFEDRKAAALDELTEPPEHEGDTG